jgi:polyhydroxybutyrate depolymerase
MPATTGGPWTPTFEAGQVTVTDPTTGVDTVRDYAFLRPDPAATEPVPLLLAFHGGGGNAGTIAAQLGFTQLTAPLPFLTVFPEGTDVSIGNPVLDGVWNSGHAYQGAQLGVDDVAFVDALLIDVAARAATAGLRVDRGRTYACGFSNGGMMAYRLAAERSREFAAIAVICASIGGVADTVNAPDDVHINDPAVHGAEPVAVLHLQGLLDDGSPVYGGQDPAGPTPRSDLPTMDAIDLWTAHNACDPIPWVESTPHGVLRTWAGGDEDTEVKLLVMPGRGHGVPDWALDVILPFFDAHQR